jgi:hypothetical protein
MSQTMRAAVASYTAAAFFVAGCSGPVPVSKHDLAPSTEWVGLYRVTTKTDQFIARHFSIKDTALVITELGGEDKHYAVTTLPVSIPLDEVKSVERLDHKDTQRGVTIAALVVVSLLIAAIIIGSQIHWNND